MYCPLTQGQPALLLCSSIIYHLPIPFHNVLIEKSLTVNSNIEKGFGTFHSSSHILTWLHFSKSSYFLFDF